MWNDKHEKHIRGNMAGQVPRSWILRFRDMERQIMGRLGASYHRSEEDIYPKRANQNRKAIGAQPHGVLSGNQMQELNIPVEEVKVGDMHMYAESIPMVVTKVDSFEDGVAIWMKTTAPCSGNLYIMCHRQGKFTVLRPVIVCPFE
jgi:hypothetical protein